MSFNEACSNHQMTTEKSKTSTYRVRTNNLKFNDLSVKLTSIIIHQFGSESVLLCFLNTRPSLFLFT